MNHTKAIVNSALAATAAVALHVSACCPGRHDSGGSWDILRASHRNWFRRPRGAGVASLDHVATRLINAKA